ncbi:MAG: hypothetical protein DYH06_17355, partial [Acidobacteria bacterium ACB2]|nr:hypothetical protein [Acidobacteria bacterium ACB2]
SQFATNYQIETVKFSDGTTQSLVGLQIVTNGTAGDDYLPGIQANASQDDTIKGMAGNDTIYGYEGNDVLTGGTGNDYIDGGYGNDIFAYNAGDGVDTLTDGAGNDVIQVGAGYTKTDLTWSRVAGTNDLAISLKGVQVMTVQNHFTDGYAVETVSFTDGTTYDLTHLTMTTTGTSAIRFEGLTSAHAPTNPVSSSAARIARSIGVSRGIPV